VIVQARNGRCGERGALAPVLALLTAASVAAAAVSGVGPARAAGEKAAGETAAPAAVPSANPLSGDPAAIEEGHKLYAMWCGQCHGPKADGVSERWGKYAADLRAFWRGYDEFVRITHEGVPDKQMPPWEGVLNDEQIAQIGAWLETQAIEGANWQ
jgi:mono/diheme cytochrome c family protein